MATATTAGKTTQIEVPPIRVEHVLVTLTGDSRLVTHRFSQKAIDLMLDKQMGKAKQGKSPKVPTEDFLGGLYPMPDATVQVRDEDPENIYATGRFGFPSCGIKAAVVRAATDAGMKMTDVRRAFHIAGELTEILCEPGPYMRQDMVRVGMGTADIRFRPEFREWKMVVPVLYNMAVISREQLVNLFRLAGFGVGLGEWRPEREGSWGTFSVEGVEVLKEGLL